MIQQRRLWSSQKDRRKPIEHAVTDRSMGGKGAYKYWLSCIPICDPVWEGLGKVRADKPRKEVTRKTPT